MLNWWWKRRGNGGGIILLRTVWVSGLTYAMALGFHERVTCSARCAFEWAELWRGIDDTIPWLAAVFAGVYATLYSRFASQWTYLAGVYNQIKACEAAAVGNVEALAQWKAGFIEDADDLHLAGKAVFASTIRNWLSNQKVCDQFDAHTAGGAARRADLARELKPDNSNASPLTDSRPAVRSFLERLTEEQKAHLLQELEALLKPADSVVKKA